MQGLGIIQLMKIYFTQNNITTSFRNYLSIKNYDILHQNFFYRFFGCTFPCPKLLAFASATKHSGETSLPHKGLSILQISTRPRV